ncbi:MAG: DUF4105 domain-containing protein [Prevotellaceae bacterium]|jgi:hypothetical protein|nr:DUF4105 domain-containing protein [Prevotellaceae bacterium]
MKKKLKLLFFLSLLFLLFSVYSVQIYAQYFKSITDLLSASSQISILTSSPYTDEVYTVFGHSAIHIKDHENGIDDVYNYGIFDFKTPNFIWRFATGETDYIVAKTDFDDYLFEYQLRGSTVYEQIVNLTYDEKQQIYNFLEKNIKPENRTYRYNEIFNNCTTKLIEIIETNIINGQVVYPPDNDPKTFRELLSEFTYAKPWLEFGINIIFSSGADKHATLKEKMFLPLYQMNTLNNTLIMREDGKIEPLILSNEILTSSEVNKTDDINFFVTPLFIGLVLLFLSIIISLYEYKTLKNTLSRFFDSALFFVIGLLGCVIIFFTFTLHPFTYPNWNLIWLNPLSLILAFSILVKSQSKFVLYYQLMNSIILSVFLIALYFIPQSFEPTFIPFILSVWIRTVMYTGNNKYINYQK